MSESEIPYARPSVSAEDIESVVEVLRSGWLTQGPATELFESALAEACGVDHVVATSSATAALHLSCLALDSGPGDVVWTTPNTYVATANAALYTGAAVDFIDIDSDTWNLDVGLLEERLLRVRKGGEAFPAVVIPVHFAGTPCDMSKVGELREEFGFRVIEDASHALGASYGSGESVGACRYSDITVFSFHAIKMITTGEGGAVATNDGFLAERVRRMRSHGIERHPPQTPPSNDPSRFAQVELGFNYRMTDVQAALGTSQIRRLETFVEVRRGLSARYSAAFEETAVVEQEVADEVRSSRHLYPVRVPSPLRGRVISSLRDNGVEATVHYKPVYLQPYYRALGHREGICPQAERYFAGAVTLPLFVGLSHDEQDRVVEAVLDATE